MKRKMTIYNCLHSFSEEVLSRREETIVEGISATAIGERSNCHRSNASRDLNALVLEGKALKIKGKPTTFLSVNALKNVLPTLELQSFIITRETLLSYLHDQKQEIEKSVLRETFADDFIDLIGSKSSLRAQIEQSKAAVLYPPNGLHMMILGETGVGKSTFVEFIHTFLQKNRSIDTPLVVFNCADYINCI